MKGLTYIKSQFNLNVKILKVLRHASLTKMNESHKSQDGGRHNVEFTADICPTSGQL